jgi:hypothetical protein
MWIWARGRTIWSNRLPVEQAGSQHEGDADQLQGDSQQQHEDDYHGDGEENDRQRVECVGSDDLPSGWQGTNFIKFSIKLD